jgi:hypothetical protein
MEVCPLGSCDFRMPGSGVEHESNRADGCIRLFACGLHRVGVLASGRLLVGIWGERLFLQVDRFDIHVRIYPVERNDAHEIIEASMANSSPALKAKLMRALCGPISPSMKSRKTAKLAIRCSSFRSRQTGGTREARLGEPDIKLHAPAALFQTECKRPFWENSVRTNTEDAASQLEKELNKPGNESDYGVVAISLNRVFTKGDLGCYAPAGTGRQVIGEALAETLDENTQQWGLKRFREMHPRIVACSIWQHRGTSAANV